MTDAGRGPAASGVSGPSWLVGAFALGAGVLCWVGTRQGVGLTPDSATYVAMSRSLVGPDALVGIDGNAQAMFPPGYPALLALGRGVGLDVLVAARIVGVVSAMLVVGAVGDVLVGRRLRTGVTVGALVATVAAVPLLSVTIMAWSEAPFIAVVAVTLAVLDRIARGCGPRRAEIPAALVLCATATMLRITGVALLVPLAITLFTVRPDRGRRQRALLTLGAITACMLPLALWTVGNRVGTGSWAGDRPGSRTDLAGAVSSLVATLHDWVAPESITAIVVVAAAVVTAVVLLADTTPGESVRDTFAPQLDAVVPWVAFIAAYVGFQLVAQLTTSLDGLGTRLLAPVWPALVVTGALVAEHIADRGRAARLAGWLIVAWLALIATSTAAELRTWSQDGRAYAQPRWRTSQLLRQVELLPPDVLLVSDQPGAIVVFTDRRSAIEPPVSSPFGTTVPGPANRDRFVRSIACAPAGAYLVWFDDAPRELFTPEQIGRLVTTTEVAATSDGTIWRLDAPAHQTC